MALLNAMVRADSGAQMIVVSVKSGLAECLLITPDGGVELRTVYASSLRLMSEVLLQVTKWPTTNHFDEAEILAEERRAKQEKQDKRKAARKARSSKKIKRGKNG